MISPPAVRSSGHIAVDQSLGRSVALWAVAVLGIGAGAALTETGLALEGGAVAVLGLAPLFLGLERRLFPGLLIGPLAFLYLYHALGYAIGPLWQIHVLGSFDGTIESGFVPAQWGAVLGLVSFAGTFPRFFRAVLRWGRASGGTQPTGKPDPQWRSYGLLMLPITAALLAYGFTTGATNRLAAEQTTVATSSIVAAVWGVNQVTFFFLGYSAARGGGLWLVLWVLVFVVYALFFLLDGSRGTVSTAAILSAIGFVWGGTSPRKVLLLGAISTVGFIPLSGMVLIYRSHYADSPHSLEGRLEGLSAAMEEFIGERASFAGYTEIFMRNLTVQSVDHVFLLTPDVIPFAGLEGIDQVPFAFVPRIVQDDRPDLLDGNELAIRFGAARPGTTGSYMPAVGDGYRRAGWAGVALVYAFSAALYGPVLAVCWARRQRREYMAMLIFVLTHSPGVLSATVLTTFYFALWTLPKYWAFFWLLSRLHETLVQLFSTEGNTGVAALRPRHHRYYVGS